MVDRSFKVACRPGSRMVDGTVVSRFIRLPLESFALRSAVQLQSESALSSGFSGPFHGGGRGILPLVFRHASRSKDDRPTIPAVRPHPPRRIDTHLQLGWEDVGTCRVAAQYTDARISFCGYRRGNPPFFRTRAESAESRENGVCVHTFVEA